MQTDLESKEIDQTFTDLDHLRNGHKDLQQTFEKVQRDLNQAESLGDANEFVILDLRKDKKDLQEQIEILKSRKDIKVNQPQEDTCKDCESSISDVSEKPPVKVIKTKTVSKWGTARKAFLLNKNSIERPKSSLYTKSPSKYNEDSIDNPAQIQDAKYLNSFGENKSRERSNSIKKINSRFHENGPILDLIVTGKS